MTTAGEQMDQERFAELMAEWYEEERKTSYYNPATAARRKAFLAGKEYGLSLRGCCEDQKAQGKG